MRTPLRDVQAVLESEVPSQAVPIPALAARMDRRFRAAIHQPGKTQLARTRCVSRRTIWVKQSSRQRLEKYSGDSANGQLNCVIEEQTPLRYRHSRRLARPRRRRGESRVINRPGR